MLKTELNFAAPSVSDVQAAIEYIFPLVYEFRKERTREELEALAQKRRAQHADDDLLDPGSVEEASSTRDGDWD